jgi:hypothetical protein
VPAACLEQIPSRHDGVHDGIRNRFLAARGGQVKDHCGIGRGGRAILLRQQVALKDGQACVAGVTPRDRVERGWVGRGPRETAHIREAALEEPIHKARADEAACTGHENGVIGTDDRRLAAFDSSARRDASR